MNATAKPSFGFEGLSEIRPGIAARDPTGAEVDRPGERLGFGSREAARCTGFLRVVEVLNGLDLCSTRARHKRSPSRDAAATKAAILGMADIDEAARQEIGNRLAARVADFTPDKLVGRTEKALRRLLAARSA
jgi:glycosyltransferase involved in cell wall biosynthesis